MKHIAASILGKDNKNELVNDLIKKGVEMIHYDLMDSKFVEASSLPITEIIDIVNSTDKHIVDVHLMSETPDEDIAKIVDIADYITFHIEATGIKKAEEILNKYKGFEIGIAINPETSVKEIQSLIPFVSHVLVMSVVPGKGGQTFIEDSLSKIKELWNSGVPVQVDGGINYEWSNKCFDAGAASVVSGSFLISKIDEDNFFENMKKKN